MLIDDGLNHYEKSSRLPYQSEMVYDCLKNAISENKDVKSEQIQRCISKSLKIINN